MLNEALEGESPFQKIAVWKFCRFTRKREHAAFESTLRPSGPSSSQVTPPCEHAAGIESTLRQRHTDRRAD